MNSATGITSEAPPPKAAAEQLARLIVTASDLVAKYFDGLSASNIDPNTGLLFAKVTILNHMPFLGEVRASNIVRLAIHKCNASRGVETYTRDELKIICHRIAHG